MPSPPDPLFLFASIFQVLAAVLAIFVARRRREHRAIAWFLGAQVVANVLHEVLRLGVLEPARAAAGGAPFEGSTRVVGHLVTALGLTWPFSLAAAALVVFNVPRARAHVVRLAVVWLGVSALLAITYPTSRGPVLARELLACELAGAAVGVVSLVSWWRRTEERERADVEQLVMFMLLAIELFLIVVGPWSANLFGSWGRAQTLQAVMYAAIVFVEGRYLWIGGSSSRAS